MDFERFALARDLLYLAALFLGAGIGCMLNYFRKKSSESFRNLSVTAGLVFFSGTSAALTAAIIFSNWMIFAETTLYLPLAILAAIFALALRFPRAAGFPFILVSGVFVVWMGYACLRFPLDKGSGLASVIRDESGTVFVRLASPATGQPGNATPDSSLSIKAEDDLTNLEFRAFRVLISKDFPLVGGIDRSAIAEIRGDSKLLYADPRLVRRIFPDLYTRPGAQEARQWLISFEEVSMILETGELFPGAARTLQFEASGLTFR